MSFFSLSSMHQIILSSIFLAVSTASPLISRNATGQFTFDEITPSETLTWYPCYDSYKCAKLDVPLDYSLPNGTRASVPLIKIDAQLNETTDKYQGMLLTNPGGPGESGVNWILQHGYADLLSVIPKTYDVVSWEPRGLGYSIPAADCQLPSSAKSKRAYEISGPDVTNTYYTEIFQSAAQLGAQCQATIGGPDEAGQHMSTPVVVRDIISILDAYAQTDEGNSVDSPADLNYWGFSYGTVVGQTFASTYPDRVGRFAMDGVVDADDYYAQGYFSTSYYSDALVDIFFEYCFQAGPKLCPFATGTSSQNIKTRFLNLFSKFDVTTAYSEKWENATTLENALATMLSTLRVMTYTPVVGFPQMAQTLVAYENTLNNLTLENIQTASQVAVPAEIEMPGVSTNLQEWTPAVACSEASILQNKTIADFAESNAILRNQSYVAHVGWTSLKILCSGWTIDGKWQFKGPLGAATKNPVLFISNTYDPATVIDNSKKWVPHYKDSQLLTIDAVGHTSYILKNSCANKKIHDFLKDGTLPGSDNFCASEVGPFGVTLKDLKNYLPAANSTTGTTNTSAIETRTSNVTATETSITPATGGGGRTGESGIYPVAAFSLVISFFVWLF